MIFLIIAVIILCLIIGLMSSAFSFTGSLMKTQTERYNKQKEERKKKDALHDALKTYGTGKH